MGSNLSLCTSCHRPLSSPSESLSSFLKVAPIQTDQKSSSNIHEHPHHPPKHSYIRSSSQTKSCTNTEFSDFDSPSLAALQAPLASPCASDLTVQKSSNPSSILWLSAEDDCFSPGVDKLSPDPVTYTRTPFIDPYIEALTDTTKPPPLPPRSLRWKKKHTSGGSSTDDSGRYPSSDPGHISSDLANLPRIYPIKKNGIQISNTHYWVIPPPKKRSQTKSFNRHSSGDPYINVSEHHYSPEPSSKDNTIDAACHRLKRGRSENYKECLWNIHRGQVLRLRKLVPSATETEAYLVLLGASWNFEEAAQRLKQELIFKSGYASIPHSHYLLVKNNWNFTAALNEAEMEHKQRILLQ